MSATKFDLIDATSGITFRKRRERLWFNHEFGVVRVPVVGQPDASWEVIAIVHFDQPREGLISIVRPSPAEPEVIVEVALADVPRELVDVLSGRDREIYDRFHIVEDFLDRALANWS